ncbi:MAG TPA: methylated-DNA--[protein]-cysteine S-methyltransferase [Treponema sp.]|uniref:methylated-DNA--[protein]-cysteine S-methyltransferase n=1 Tax=Gracilinema caldarium TaxID=215591 RepID=UPI0026F263D8|nr:methylated-DNA--[protein]-cysteine S-methyltransferase [Gracilinema caldarium]HPC72352.1 methylated-DNA--[protein]-cysteine S-methyltransferase [Treponema sp.]
MGKETFLNSPLGLLKIVYNESALEEILFLDQVDEVRAGSVADLPPFVGQLAAELEAYFNGKLQTFSVPINLDRGTDFQRRVWQALLAIPYGKTVTYGELARSLGLSAGASRAVGNACGANPLPIIVPCHRVVAANGSLGGYSGGLWRKEGLLKVERQ